MKTFKEFVNEAKTVSITFKKNPNDKGTLVSGKDLDDVMMKANKDIARKLKDFYGWQGDTKDGGVLTAMYGTWD